MPYKLTKNSFLDIGSGASIPFSPGNRHYNMAVEELVDAGLMTVDDDNAPISFSPDEVLLFSPDVSALDEVKEQKKQAISVEANVLINAQIGNDPRQQLMTVARAVNLLDAQVGRGGNPSRNPQMDDLVGVFAYVEAVNSEETIAFSDIDAALDETEIDAITLVHPTLPV